jgi:hypothetical protein
MGAPIGWSPHNFYVLMMYESSMHCACDHNSNPYGYHMHIQLQWRDHFISPEKNNNILA